MVSFHIFFFQAEDGIRDYKVTGVQTCALPISSPRCLRRAPPRRPKCRIAETKAEDPSGASSSRTPWASMALADQDRKSGVEGKRGGVGGGGGLQEKKKKKYEAARRR